jgi:hypothetical protein
MQQNETSSFSNETFPDEMESHVSTIQEILRVLPIGKDFCRNFLEARNSKMIVRRKTELKFYFLINFHDLMGNLC